MKKIDCHMHVNGGLRKWGWADNDRVIDAADRLGIEHLCCSIPVTRGLPEPQAAGSFVFAAALRSFALWPRGESAALPAIPLLGAWTIGRPIASRI